MVNARKRDVAWPYLASKGGSLRYFLILYGSLAIAFFGGHLVTGVSAGLYDGPQSAVRVLDGPGFLKHVKGGKSDNLWLVEFFAPWCGHCKALAPHYEKAAKALKGIVQVAAVEDQAVMAQEQVQGFPTIKLYLPRGAGVRDYTGERTADALVKFVMRESNALVQKRLTGSSSSSSRSQKREGQKSPASSGELVELSETNFDTLVMRNETATWFVKFYAPWCHHCKALEPTWDSLARTMKGKVNVGRVDATTNTALAQRFSVKGYPTLLLFPAGKKSDSRAVPYNGPRELNELLDFTAKFAGALITAEQLVSQSQFNANCDKKLCILAFLPRLSASGASGRKKYLEDYNSVVKASASLPIQFFWAQGSDNDAVERAFRLDFGYPAVLALHLGKQKYSVHKGAFTFNSLRSFLTGLMSGRQPLYTIPDSLPNFATVEPWDGKDVDPSSHGDEEEEEEEAPIETDVKQSHQTSTGPADEL